MIDNLIHAALLMTTPVLLAALGGLINRTGGIVNIGLDSSMLTGALIGLILAANQGSWVVALLGAGLIGAVMGLAMSLVITRLDANEIIVGLGFNIVAAGLVRFFLKSNYEVAGTLRLPDVTRLPRWDIPVIVDIPVLGAIFSGHDILTWTAWILVPVTVWFLKRTRGGLRLRAAASSHSRPSISAATGRC